MIGIGIELSCENDLAKVTSDFVQEASTQKMSGLDRLRQLTGSKESNELSGRPFPAFGV